MKDRASRLAQPATPARESRARAAPIATSVASTNSRRVLFFDSWRSDALVAAC